MSIPNVFRDHFQTAYVVRNFDAASRNFVDKMGVTKWQVIDMPAGYPISRIGLAWVQNIMIELIEAVPGQPSIYASWLPQSESAARFHHHGFLIEKEEDFRRAAAQFNAAGYADVMSGNNAGLLNYHYADTVADLGHYCELVNLTEAGKDFFAAVPHN